MDEKKWEMYLDEVLSFVKFKYDHGDIRRELAEHMADLKEDLMADGMDEEAAEYMTIAHMGDAAEIGQELNKEHHALLGWVWRIARVLVVVLLLMSVVPVIDCGIYLFSSFVGNEYNPELGNGEIWHMEIEREFRTYDDTLILKDILYYPSGTLDVRYVTKRDLFSKSGFGTKMLGHELFDENGEELPHNAGGWKNGGYNGKGQLQIREVTEKAKKLVLYYGYELEIHVDLETGEVTEK